MRIEDDLQGVFACNALQQQVVSSTTDAHYLRVMVPLHFDVVIQRDSPALLPRFTRDRNAQQPCLLKSE